MKEFLDNRTPFVISEVEIVNLGSIDHLKIDLHPSEKRALNCIYASNGIGKTTMLEALSLIGHLPCMARLDVGRGKRRSLLAHLSDEAPVDDEASRTLPNLQPGSLQALEGGVAAWFRDLVGQAKAGHPQPHAAVRYRVFDGNKEGGSRLTHNFYIVIAPPATGDSVTLTSLLSRENDDGEVTGDGQLEDIVCVVSDRLSKSDHDNLDELVWRIARGRTFSLDGDTHLRAAELPGSAKSALSAKLKGPKRKVCYINTDLNDFGRGNDLRESPKSLTKSFAGEVLDQFMVRFRDDKSYPFLNELNNSIEYILKATGDRYSDIYAVKSVLKLRNLTMMELPTGRHSWRTAAMARHSTSTS